MTEEEMVKELKKCKKDELIEITVATIRAIVPDDQQEGFLRKMFEILNGEN